MDRRQDLLDARERLWDGINGDRLLERNGKDGETYTARESLAPLIRELRAVTRELAELGEVDPEVSAADEIAARREARVAGAGGSARTPRRSQPRRSGGGNRAS